MAINTSRAKKVTTDPHFLGQLQTTERVGPGTYSNTHNEPRPVPGESAVPFSSLQEKVLNPNKSTSGITPGPGAYMAEKKAAPLREGYTALRNRSARMGPTSPGSSVYTASTIERNPGPGTYKPEPESLAAKLEKPLVQAMKPVGEASAKTTPSIPMAKLLPGAKPDPYGDAEMTALVMRHTGEPKDMVGPGEYDPSGQDIVAASAPTTAFYASKLGRKLFDPSVSIENTLYPPRENPGPGTYEMKQFLSDQSKEAELDASTFQFASRTLRTHQIEILEDRILPGPGRYNIGDDIEQGANSARQKGMSLGERAQFGSMAARIGWSRDIDQPFTDQYNIRHVPGPGHYSARQSSFPEARRKKEAEKALPEHARKKMHGVHHPNLIMALQDAHGPLQAFNSTDDRYCNKVLEQVTPSPDEYNKEDARSSSIAADLRERAKVGRKGGFGTCAHRFYGSPLNARTGAMEAGMDFVGEGTSTEAHQEPRSIFQSQTARFQEEGAAREVHAAVNDAKLRTPAPGAYEVQNTPNYRSPFRQPRTSHLSFGSGGERYCGKDKDFFTGHMPDYFSPGPGSYEPRSQSRPRGGADLKAQRPKPYVGCTTAAVGPGSYNQESTLLKKSINVTTEAPAGEVRASRGAGSVTKGSVR